MIILLIVLGFIFASFCATLASSLAILVFTWNSKPRFQRKALLCFLSTAMGIALWLAMLALLFEPLVQTINNLGLFSLFIFAILAGATPMAALPGIYLFGGKRNHR